MTIRRLSDEQKKAIAQALLDLLNQIVLYYAVLIVIYFHLVLNISNRHRMNYCQLLRSSMESNDGRSISSLMMDSKCNIIIILTLFESY